jgi:hypothetical protein
MYVIRVLPDSAHQDPRWARLTLDNQRYTITLSHKKASHFFTLAALRRMTTALKPADGSHFQTERCDCPSPL